MTPEDQKAIGGAIARVGCGCLVFPGATVVVGVLAVDHDSTGLFFVFLLMVVVIGVVFAIAQGS